MTTKTPLNAATTQEYGGPRCFRIIRFFRIGRKSRTIKSNLTEIEAQTHCLRDDTHEEGVYFDGYDYMKGCKP